MKLRDRIAELLTSVPKWKLCDACIQKALGLASSHGINRATLILSTHGFVREFDSCSGCGEVRKIIYPAVP